MENMSSKELAEKYRELSEVIAVIRWDMRQQADEFDYALLKTYEKKCEEINEELVARGYWVV